MKDHHIVTKDLCQTVKWLLQNQACFDSFEFNVLAQTLTVHHLAGTDIVREGMSLTAKYGILVTS